MTEKPIIDLEPADWTVVRERDPKSQPRKRKPYKEPKLLVHLLLEETIPEKGQPVLSPGWIGRILFIVYVCVAGVFVTGFLRSIISPAMNYAVICPIERLMVGGFSANPKILKDCSR